MRISGRRRAFLAALFSSVATLTSAIAQTSVTPTLRDSRQADNSRGAGAICLLATDYYAVSPSQRLFDINPATGVGSFARVTGAFAITGLAWAADGNLYAFRGDWASSNHTIYRVDPVAGTATMVGQGTGASYIRDLATNPAGVIYAIGGGGLFRFPNLTAASPNVAIQTVGLVNFPSYSGPYPHFWTSLGLAFDQNGRLFVVATPGGVPAGPPFSHLLELNPATAAVIGDVTLSQRFSSLGGLDIVDGRFFYADSSLYEINPSTGQVVTIGSTNIAGGVSSLVSCQTQLEPPPPPPPPPPCTPPPPDMDAWYPMEGTGADRVLGNNAVISGTVTFPNGRVGRSLRLQGGYLRVPLLRPVLNQGLGDFSIDLWILVAAGQSGPQAIVDKRGAGPTGPIGWVMFLYNNRPGLQLANTGAENFVDARTMSAGWHHVAVTVDRDNPSGVVFYIDGVAGTPLDPTHRQGNLDSNVETWFGRDHVTSAVSVGLEIDEVEFFDRALAPGEPLAIFNAGQTGKCFATGTGWSP